MRIAWFIFGSISLTSGIVGAFLPIIPTVPFLLLAAFSFSKSSNRLHVWMLEHPRFGPPIHDWYDKGVVRRRAKYMASVSMAASVGLAVLLGLSLTIIMLQAAIMIAVGVFIWTRPEN